MEVVAMTEVIKCPLSKDFVCDIPKTRELFLETHEGGLCDDGGAGGKCLVRKELPKSVIKETDKSFCH